MSQGLCTSCGAAVNLAAEQNEINCTYCGTLVKRPEAEVQFAEVKNSKFGGTLLIAETAQEGGSYTEALNYYNKVIEQQPDFADAWLNKGTCTVRTSKIGDLKIPEAISSWKAAIKFAKNSEAMKKRVALEINNAVTDFYPILAQHYQEVKQLDNSFSEFLQRFLLLESALAMALEIDPSRTIIAQNGIDLCNDFLKQGGLMWELDGNKIVQSIKSARQKYATSVAKGETGLPINVEELIRKGNDRKHEAIKELRFSRPGMGLAEAKKIIEEAGVKMGTMTVTKENKKDTQAAALSAAESQKSVKAKLTEFHVSNRMVIILVIWCCRIVGILGCLGAIGIGIDAINGKAKPDAPGIGSSILVFLIFGGITAYGFFRRKKTNQ